MSLTREFCSDLVWDVIAKGEFEMFGRNQRLQGLHDCVKFDMQTFQN